MWGPAVRGKAKDAWAAILAGLLLRCLFVALHPRFAGDTLVYGDLAHNLLAHHLYGLTEDHVRSTLIRLPGYPLFLALCFVCFGDANYLPVLAVQVAIDLAGCVLLGRLAERLWGWRAGRAVLWLAALCPFTANYAAAALTETLTLFCITLAFWAAARWLQALRQAENLHRWAIPTGLGLAGAALLRPDGILLAAAVLPPLAWARGARPARGAAWRSLGVMTLVLLLPLAVWAGRNWHRFHVLQPLAPKYANDPDEAEPLGFARWYRSWAIDFTSTVDVYWTYDGSPLRLADLPPRAMDNAAQRQQTTRLYARYNDLQSATPGIDAAFGRLAAERVRRHPMRYYLLLPVARLADMWLRPRTELLRLPLDWWRVRAHPGVSSFEIGYALLNAALLSFAALGWWRWWRWRSLGWCDGGPIAAAATLYVLLRCAMLLTIDNSEPRYTLECFPMVLLLAGLQLARQARSPTQG